MPQAAQQSVARGNPPSSLQQQAAQLSSGAPAMTPPYAVRGPLPVETVAVTSGSGGYEIQSGAYGSAGEADRALTAARSSVGDLLRTSQARTFAISKDGRQVFRARFVGFDSRTAASTCVEMRRRQIDCFVMRSE
jgi:D-alanyl-D-alanine carboxypeptidase